MADIRRIPFTEMVERLQSEVIRDASATEGKYKGRINDIYLYDFPAQIDWRHIRQTGSITTIADYNTGYITDISSTTVTGDSDCVWTSAIANNMLLKVSGYDEVYRVTYVSATSLTLDRAWIGDAISSDEVSYSLIQDRYALASNYERMILSPDKSVYYWNGGNKNYLKYRDTDYFEEKQVITASPPSHYTDKWVNGDPYIYIDPPDTAARTVTYAYIPTLKRMNEYDTGTISTLANGNTAVTGSGTDFDGFVTDTSAYDYYLRIDGDGTGSESKWYKIASADSDTGITLSDSYEGTSISGGSEEYTISVISLLPSGLDMALIYQAAVISATEQTNKIQIAAWSALASDAVNKYRAVEGKKDYGQRRIKTIYERAGVRR